MKPEGIVNEACAFLVASEKIRKGDTIAPEDFLSLLKKYPGLNDVVHDAVEGMRPGMGIWSSAIVSIHDILPGGPAFDLCGGYLRATRRPTEEETLAAKEYGKEKEAAKEEKGKEPASIPAIDASVLRIQLEIASLNNMRSCADQELSLGGWQQDWRSLMQEKETYILGLIEELEKKDGKENP